MIFSEKWHVVLSLPFVVIVDSAADGEAAEESLQLQVYRLSHDARRHLWLLSLYQGLLLK